MPRGHVLCRRITPCSLPPLHVGFIGAGHVRDLRCRLLRKRDRSLGVHLVPRGVFLQRPFRPRPLCARDIRTLGVWGVCAVPVRDEHVSVWGWQLRPLSRGWVLPSGHSDADPGVWDGLLRWLWRMQLHAMPGVHAVQARRSGLRSLRSRSQLPSGSHLACIQLHRGVLQSARQHGVLNMPGIVLLPQ